MRKHSGWYNNYLLFANDYRKDGKLQNMTTIANLLVDKSLHAHVIPQLRGFDLSHSRFSIYKELRDASIFLRPYITALYPVEFGMSIFFNLNLLRSLALRQHKVKRLLCGYPIRGQRSWSNANTARKCCLFFRQSISAYERELWGYKQPKKKHTLTKLDEARFSASHRVVKKKKFVTKKIKSKKELVLRRKKQKKTPWR